MRYMLATTEVAPRWYVQDQDKPSEYELVDRLDLSRVTIYQTKPKAERAALVMRLTSRLLIAIDQ